VSTSSHARVGAVLIIAALVAAAPFTGPEARFLAVALTLMIAWLVSSVWRGYRDGLRIPRTALSLWLTLFWAWLGLSVTWSPVAQVSVYTFWWMAGLPLAYWAYTLAPDREAVWRHAAQWVLVLGVALAVAGVVQKLALGQPAQSIFRTANTHAAILNLIVLPASGYFLVALNKAIHTRRMALLGIGVFILFFGIAHTGGRGAFLSLVLGLAVLVVVAMRYGRRRDVTILLGMFVAAFVAADVSGQGQFSDRVETLWRPLDAAFTRIVIWQPAWELVKESPWLGTGIGTYYLVASPDRHPADTSAGFFVHNDYLQLWLETGVAGLMLLLVTQTTVVVMMARALAAKIDALRKIEVSGLFAALLAVSAHSFVDFNFYILLILLMSGLMLARFQERASALSAIRVIELRPRDIVGKGSYRAIALLLVMFPIFYFLAQGLSDHFRNQAWRYSVEGRLSHAERALDWSQRLTPANARIFNARAELYRHALSSVKRVSPISERRALFDRALECLDQSERLNPLRAITFDIRAHLIEQNPHLAGDDWKERTDRAYQRALQLDPRLAQTRAAYAHLLLQLGDATTALRVVEQGLAYRYGSPTKLAPLLDLAGRIRRQAGEADESASVDSQARSL